MMNVLQIQDDLKNFSEDQLVKEMQQPSGNAPQFLILSELNRRRRVKGEFAARQAQKAPTVAEEAIAAAGVPQAGMMGMSEAMAPASVDSGGIGSMMPKTMKMGGEVDEYAEGGVIKAQKGLSIADRNLNPGNVRPAGFFGETGVGSGYATYASPEFGLRSIAMLSDKYATDYGVGTVNDFIEKYAPKKDKNLNNKAYAKMVADSLGVDPDDKVDFTDDNVKRAIIPAITKFEGFSQDIDSDMLDKAIAASKVTEDESKVNELLSGVDSLGQTALTYNATPMKSGIMSAMASTNNQSTSNVQSSSKVPKGVRPDFNINSVPKNIREKKYLEQLKKEQLIGKQQKRPILSDIINKEIEKQKKNPEPSLIDQILSPDDEIYNIRGVKEQPSIVGDDPSGEIESMDYGPAGLKRPELGIFGKLGKALGGKRFGQPGEILNESPYGSTLRPFDAEDEKLGDKSSIPLGAGASYEEFLKKNFPEDYKKQFEDKINILKSDPKITVDAQNVLEENKAMIGDVTPEVMNIANQVTGTTNLEKPDPKKQTTQLTSLEQELLNRQNQLQKDRDFDRYMALAQAGLSIMSSDKPTLAGAIGEGGTAGLEAFRGAQKRYQEGLNDILNARVKLAGKKGGLTQKEAINAISAIDSNIATLRGKMASATDPAIIKEIQNEIAQFNFQKESLMPRAGFSRLSMNVSDSAAK